jgi:predicted DNA-binding transcriptional regulator AlpA
MNNKKNNGKETLTGKSRKIRNVEELANLADRGVLVVCPAIDYMETPRKVEQILGLSVRSILNMISKGLYAIGEVEAAPEGSLLEIFRNKIRATGLSHDEIAQLVGVSRPAVTQVMNASSVQTRTLDKYLNALGIFK